MEFLNELGQIPNELENIVMSETRRDALKVMLKIAVTSKSISEFEEKIANL